MKGKKTHSVSGKNYIWRFEEKVLLGSLSMTIYEVRSDIKNSSQYE